MTQSDKSGLRMRLHEIIFEADTPMGKVFDVLLIASILLSVLTVMLDSVASVRASIGGLLLGLEWFFTGLFTVEYILRLYCVGKPLRYARSFYGVVDLLAILPTYVSLLLPGSQFLGVIRVLRILRVFRVFKLAKYLKAARVLREALLSGRRKIAVFMFAVFNLVTVLGSFMYIIEGSENGFTSIPRSIYWAIVTMTTVGYGDISPKTDLGQAFAALVMVLGYAIIAVPTGIVTAEIVRGKGGGVTTKCCAECSEEGHDRDAVHCKYCGAKL